MKDEEAIMDHSMTGAHHAALDHDEFGSNRSKLINVIDPKTLARDSREKPVSAFSHPALSPEDFHAVPRLRRRLSEIRTYGYRPTPARLTGQQLLIAQLTALGLANKEIAYLADISETTVKAHISAALRSLNLKRRTQLCRYIFESGLLGEEPQSLERCHR